MHDGIIVIKMNVPPPAGCSFCLLVAAPQNPVVCTRRYEAAGVLIGRCPVPINLIVATLTNCIKCAKMNIL